MYEFTLKHINKYINKVLNNIYVTLRHINMHEFSLNTLTYFNNAN